MGPATSSSPTSDAGHAFGRTLVALTIGLVLLIATGASWLSLDRSPAASPLVVFLIWINILIMLWFLALEVRRRPYSLHVMHLLSLFLFLGAPALLQYTSGRLAVAGPIQIMRGHVLPAVVIVTLWILAYTASYELVHRFTSGERGPVLRFLDRPLMPFRTFVVLALAFASLVYLAGLGLVGAATRFEAEEVVGGIQSETVGSYGLVFSLIHSLLLRAFSIVAVLGALLLVVRDRRSRNPLLLLLLAFTAAGTLLTNNPFAASRMWFATFLIAFLAPLLLRRFLTAWGIVLIAVVGLAFLPSLNESRYSESFDELMDYFRVVSPVFYLTNSSDVDSLGMLSLCHQWAERFGHLYGSQELAALLFWFPRVIWKGKPVDLGRRVTEDLGFDFANLAPPIMSETYVDFGYVGIPLVAALLGFVFARLDRGYWEGFRGGRPRVIDAIYPVWLGCIIFLTRGGLFASLTFTTAFTVWLFPFAVGLSRSARQEQGRSGKVETSPWRAPGAASRESSVLRRRNAG